LENNNELDEEGRENSDNDDKEENKEVELGNGIVEENKDSGFNPNELKYVGTTIKDITEKTEKHSKCIMTVEGIILEDMSDLKRCHCGTKKKYKNCCSKEDIRGEYDKDNITFYCDIDTFKTRFNIGKVKEKTDQKNNKETENEKSVNNITKQFNTIYI
jgi:hypothetical protein